MFTNRNKKIILPASGQENWHENFIVHLASIIRPKVYVELGLYQCALFNKIIPYADALIGVDTSPESGKYIQNVEKTKFACCSTDEFHDELKKNPITIDMLFIDANHSKESVQKDFENFFPFIADQGIILLHDGYPKNKDATDSGFCGDGYKAIEALSKKTDTYEMVTIPVHPGITICRKRLHHLSWK